MNREEKRLSVELLLCLGALFYLWMRLTDGISVLGNSVGFIVVEQSPGQLITTYVAVGILFAIGQTLIRLVIFPTDSSEHPEDERDRLIERRADQIAYWTGLSVINLLIGHVLLNEKFGSALTPNLDFTSPAGILLGLATILIIQEMSRVITSLIYHRLS